ncbi:hypothetical protein WALBB_610028 [Wolbachia pipientis wAlbB]|nr:hypothetical protein WALBB_610028 [Wolbachia pipientis wAlbB]
MHNLFLICARALVNYLLFEIKFGITLISRTSLSLSVESYLLAFSSVFA